MVVLAKKLCATSLASHSFTPEFLGGFYRSKAEKYTYHRFINQLCFYNYIFSTLFFNVFIISGNISKCLRFFYTSITITWEASFLSFVNEDYFLLSNKFCYIFFNRYFNYAFGLLFDTYKIPFRKCFKEHSSK